MIRKLSLALVASFCLSGVSAAETFEVQMLNKGEAGRMIFDPAFVQIAAGDTVKFVAASKGHNAETIKGMLPDGAEPFKGKVNEEIEVTLNTEGLYGVMCKPHFAMGMVMTIAVGADVTVPDTFLEGRIPRKAKARFEEQLSGL